MPSRSRVSPPSLLLGLVLATPVAAQIALAAAALRRHPHRHAGRQHHPGRRAARRLRLAARSLPQAVYPGTPINIVNAGISGQKATDMQARFERDVLAAKPQS